MPGLAAQERQPMLAFACIESEVVTSPIMRNTPLI